MPLRILVKDNVLYEGETPAVPRAGELIHLDGESLPVESVTWDFGDGGAVVVRLVLGDRPYTY